MCFKNTKVRKSIINVLIYNMKTSNAVWWKECNLFFIQTFWVLSFHSNSWSKLDLFVRALMCCTIKYSFHTIGSFWKMDKLISYLFNIQNVFLDYIYMYVLTIHILNNPWHFFSRLKWFVWRFELHFISLIIIDQTYILFGKFRVFIA